jgi:hypothetical protein
MTISNNQHGIDSRSSCFWVVFGVLMSSIMHWVGLDSSGQSFFDAHASHHLILVKVGLVGLVSNIRQSTCRV